MDEVKKMAIRKKDGNLYILDGPNPIVKEQVLWNPADLVFYNFSWGEILFVQGSKCVAEKRASKPTNITQNNKEPEYPLNKEPETPLNKEPEYSLNKEPETPLNKEPETPLNKELETPLNKELETPLNKEPETPLEEIQNQEAKEFDLPYLKYRVLCYCLPATTKVHTDKLYGESWQRVAYGNKFVFPCIVMSSNDLLFEFWTSDPRLQIDENSIIYPFSYEVHNISTDSYDKVPYDEYRWWKVSRKEPKEGGWLFHCVPSQDQPDFSG